MLKTFLHANNSYQNHIKSKDFMMVCDEKLIPKPVKKVELSDEKPKKKLKPVKKAESSSSESDSSSDSSSEDEKPKKKVKPVNKSK